MNETLELLESVHPIGWLVFAVLVINAIACNI